MIKNQHAKHKARLHTLDSFLLLVLTISYMADILILILNKNKGKESHQQRVATTFDFTT